MNSKMHKQKKQNNTKTAPPPSITHKSAGTVVKLPASPAPPSSSKKTPANEIDAIFSNRPRKPAKSASDERPLVVKTRPDRLEDAGDRKPTTAEATQQQQQRGKKRNEDERERNDAADDENFANVRTERNTKKRKRKDGLAIYTLDELNIGKGGNTPLCPFNCKCCF